MTQETQKAGGETGTAGAGTGTQQTAEPQQIPIASYNAEKAKRQAAEKEAADLKAEKAERDTAAKTAEQAALEKQGEFQKLSEKQKGDLEKLKAENRALAEGNVKIRIKAKAMLALPNVKEKYLDTFFDYKAISIKDDGSYEGMDEALAKFKTDFPEILGEVKQTTTTAARRDPRGTVPTGAGAGEGKKLDPPNSRDPAVRAALRLEMQKKIAAGN